MCYIRYGEYDDEVEWPLRGSFEVMLMNQIGDRKHHSAMIKFDWQVKKYHAARRVTKVTDKIDKLRDGFGDVLISVKDLFVFSPECQYYKDDNIYLKVTFTPASVLITRLHALTDLL